MLCLPTSIDLAELMMLASTSDHQTPHKLKECSHPLHGLDCVCCLIYWWLFSRLWIKAVSQTKIGRLAVISHTSTPIAERKGFFGCRRILQLHEEKRDSWKSNIYIYTYMEKTPRPPQFLVSSYLLSSLQAPQIQILLLKVDEASMLLGHGVHSEGKYDYNSNNEQKLNQWAGLGNQFGLFSMSFCRSVMSSFSACMRTT